MSIGAAVAAGPAVAGVGIQVCFTSIAVDAVAVGITAVAAGEGAGAGRAALGCIGQATSVAATPAVAKAVQRRFTPIVDVAIAAAPKGIAAWGAGSAGACR